MRDNGLLGHSQAKLFRLFIQCRPADHLIKNGAVEPDRLRLFHREGVLCLCRESPHLITHLLIEFVSGNVGSADACHNSIAPAPENIGYTPEREGKDKHADNHGCDPRLRKYAYCLQHERDRSGKPRIIGSSTYRGK